MIEGGEFFFVCVETSVCFIDILYCNFSTDFMQDPGKSRTNFTYLLLMKTFQQEEGEFREDKILQSWRMWLSGALGNYMK